MPSDAAPRPTVNVIIPTFGRPTRLAAAIDSVRRQTFSDWSLVVVDDNFPDSPDRASTRAVVESSDVVDRIHYVPHATNLGGAAARNTGARAGHGRYLAFLDDDDIWHPTKLELQVRALAEASDRVALAYCGYRRIDFNGSETLYRPDPSRATLESLLVENAIGTTSVAMCRREAFEAVGGFDERLGSAQDIDLYVRLVERFEAVHVDEILVDYHKHGEGAIGQNVEAAVKAFHLFESKYEALLDRYPDSRRRRRRQLAELYRTSGRLSQALPLYWELWRSSPLDVELAVGLLSSTKLGGGLRARLGVALGRRVRKGGSF